MESQSSNPTNWHLHFLLEDFKYNIAGDTRKLGPITAPMALSADSFGNVWVYFGTGRYVYQSDKADANPQALFGLKDPLFNADRGYTLANYTGAPPPPRRFRPCWIHLNTVMTQLRKRFRRQMRLSHRFGRF